MDNFFAGLEYTGAPFVLFGTPHLIALGVVLLANVALVLLRKANEQTKTTFRYGLAVLLILNELAWHLWNLKSGLWNVQTLLPLHLCSVFVFLNATMLVTKSYTIYEFAYLLGIPAALQALLTPDAGMWGFPHFRFFQTTLSHGSIILAAVYMTVVEGYRPVPKSIVRVLVGGQFYMIVVGIINAILGSNYLYIARKPETASLLDVLPAWPWYLLILEVLALAFILLFYAPFAIKDSRSRPRRV
jgi:hypothetical integral membrane protein (TIGR02206 family)